MGVKAPAGDGDQPAAAKEEQVAVADVGSGGAEGEVRHGCFWVSAPGWVLEFQIADFRLQIGSARKAAATGRTVSRDNGRRGSE
jgi:hypothetical protein